MTLYLEQLMSQQGNRGEDLPFEKGGKVGCS